MKIYLIVNNIFLIIISYISLENLFYFIIIFTK